MITLRSCPIAVLSLVVLAGCNRQARELLNDARTQQSSQGAKQEKAVAAAQTASNPAVNLSVAFEPADCKPGQSVQCVAKVKIGDGWHIYAMKGGEGPSQPTRLKLELPAWITEQGEWIAPDPQVNLSHFGPEMIHTGELSFTRKLTIGSDAPAGLHHIPCSVSLQACNASRCLPPENFSLSLPMTVTSQ